MHVKITTSDGVYVARCSGSSSELLAIDRDEPLETVLKFVESTKITYPIGLDPRADIFTLYAERNAGITRNVIIDKTGKIVLLTRLYNEEEFAHMTETIDHLLKQ